MNRFLGNNEINKPRSKGCIIGDSTIAEYMGQTAVADLLLNTSDQVNGSSIDSLAVPGHTIAQQLAAWNASASKFLYDWIYVQIGCNDLAPSETAAVALSRYQSLIDKINQDKNPAAKVIVGTMIPVKARLINIYGHVDGMTAYQKWLDMNFAIMGGGDYAIADVFHRLDGHTAYLNDGSGNLLSRYDTGDGVHENTEARRIIAMNVRTMLNLIGHLRSTVLPKELYIKISDNDELSGEGLALLVVSPDGSVSRGPTITEGFTEESAVIAAIAAATFVNDRAVIAPSGGAVMYEGDKYDDGTYTYLAISDNQVRRF